MSNDKKFLNKEEAKKEIGLKVFRGGEQIPADELTIILDFDGQEAKVDLKNAVIRSLVLAQENVILKTALAQIKAHAQDDKVVGPQRFYEDEN